MSLKVAIITDIHHGLPSHTKRGDAAIGLLEQFCDWVGSEQPDLILDLGDRISDIDEETDLRLETEVAAALSAIDVPIYHICGNHDRDHLTVSQNEQILGQSLRSEIIDLGDWQILLWRADAKIEREPERRGFFLPEADLLWLSHTVQTAEKPTIVASHVPISGHSQIGNYYFQQNPQYSTYPQAERARKVLEQSRVATLMISGHVHWNTVCQINGIWHLTQQSLTESFTTKGQACGAWGLLTLSQEQNPNVLWQVFGNDPFETKIALSDARWTPPLAPF